ncbi:PaaI family thioesterase [Geoalkalibacter halelectricus]|uniref:PaaI family thioesterase n=1 Tax=Geoalkalibacter halelectricus TaxID=2847045 RepID=A0ABY5ZI55_9BACT|nr:PaaI family thioesterase [Geoalkalibacter halelectricus]MDO3379605.1 PaaI family thioesterase [Geoalkalibacter halelectricus]UWZ78579.1 PaaI family thioesterase [Geoalkalibacter halelectricus]
MARLLIDGNLPMEDAGQSTFELEGWIDTAPFEDLVGLRIESAAQGRAVLSVPFRVKLAQGGGLMHGGALTTLADTAVAMAIKSLLPPGSRFATTELSMTFLAPVHAGEVRAIAEVRGPEGRTFYGEAILLDEQESEVARFRSVFRVARGQGFEE